MPGWSGGWRSLVLRYEEPLYSDRRHYELARVLGSDDFHYARATIQGRCSHVHGLLQRWHRRDLLLGSGSLGLTL